MDQPPKDTSPVRSPVTKQAVLVLAKGAIGAVPFVGTFMNEALFEARSRIRQERLESFVHDLSFRIQQLDSSLLEPERFQNEAFMDFIEDLMVKVVQTRAHTKRALFADILVSSLHRDTTMNYDFVSDYNALLADLNEPEMSVLSLLYRYGCAAREHHATRGTELELEKIDYGLDQVYGVPTDIFRQCFETLLAKGLVYDDSVNRLSTRPRSFVKPTALAMAFMDFIAEAHEQCGSRHPPSAIG